MEKIKYPSKIDVSLFGKGNKKNVALYGLPEKVIYCKKCVISNQRPGSTIEFKSTNKEKKKAMNLDDKGVCDACNFASKKKNKFTNIQHKFIQNNTSSQTPNTSSHKITQIRKN